VNVRTSPLTRRVATAALAFFGLASLVACWSPSNGGERRYELRGKIVEVDRKHGEVGIAHEAIPGFMDAMTMSFPVADWVLTAAAPGDDITADLVVSGSDSRLENVSLGKAQTVTDPDPENAVAGAAPGSEIPGLKLENQDGRTISLHDYRGRFVIITFIYTRCPLPDYCPLMTQRFAEIDQLVRDDRDLQSRVQLISVTLDPEYDTPEVLSAYARAFHANPETARRWDFVTAQPDTIRQLAEFFGLMYRSESGQIVHSLRTAVVSPSGTVIRVFRGNNWTADEVIAVVRESAT
jgi:protein SCO1/2